MDPPDAEVARFLELSAKNDESYGEEIASLVTTIGEKLSKCEPCYYPMLTSLVLNEDMYTYFDDSILNALIITEQFKFIKYICTITPDDRKCLVSFIMSSMSDTEKEDYASALLENDIMSANTIYEIAVEQYNGIENVLRFIANQVTTERLLVNMRQVFLSTPENIRVFLRRLHETNPRLFYSNALVDYLHYLN